MTHFLKQSLFFLSCFFIQEAYSSCAHEVDVSISQNIQSSGSLSFPASAILSSSPSIINTLFSNVYGTNFSVSAWKMLPSTTTQDPLFVSFAIPHNLEQNNALFVDMDIVTSQHPAYSGNQANITVSMDYANNEEMGKNPPASGFAEIINSGSFSVMEPSTTGNLYHFRISVRLNANLAAHKDFAYMAITRTLPTGIEYNRDLYLACVTFRYE